ncbi:MAG: AmmeMemoRadiSam system protein A [Pseudomonadota bacterium]
MSDFDLTAEEKALLLRLARNEITKNLTGADEKLVLPREGSIHAHNGAFVTLHNQGRLRGCIGLFSATQALHETVCDMAYSAAFKDPRFPPLSAAELSHVDLEISVLSPLQKIADINEIEAGNHGLYIVKGFNRGVLLPQVAVEHKWDRFTFLEQTCYKAGLPGDGWRHGADIYVFTAVIFGERET